MNDYITTNRMPNSSNFEVQTIFKNKNEHENLGDSIGNYLNLRMPDGVNNDLNNEQKNYLEKVVKTLQDYYDTPPSEKILPYLLLNSIEFEKLKKKFPLKIKVEFDDNVGSSGLNSFEAGCIYSGFGWKSKKNYIVNLAYQEEYFNFFDEKDRRNYYDANMEKKVDVVFRTRALQAITKKNSGFPFDDLIYSLGLFADNK